MAEFPRTAFLLGAGLGTRLRPLTDAIPKPLLPLGGAPLVRRAMDHLLAAGVRRFLVNTHHRPEAWSAAFPAGEHRGAPVTLVHEPELLETGGGLANIAPLLTEEDPHLLVWNGDILAEPDLALLVRDHLRGKAEVTLLVRREGPNRNVRVANDGTVTDLRDRLGSADPSYQFTGICVVARGFAQSLPPSRESLVEHLLRRVAAKPGSIRASLDPSATWDDIGTPEAYAAARARHPEPVDLAAAAAAVGAALTPGGELARGASSRSFARGVSATHGPGVVCAHDGAKAENALYGPLAVILRDQLGLNAPKVLAERGNALLLEDLGDRDLLAAGREAPFPWKPYASAIGQVARLHRGGLEAAAGAGLSLSAPFDEQLYRWERDYFCEHVLAGQRLDRGVAEEMASLSRELLRQPLVAVHRDFQSQNILVRDDQAWLIDFQGMRAGCAAYDYASLILDPYVTRGDMQLWRVDLEEEAREASGWRESRDAFSHLLHTAAAQRLLQACGAYANLGRNHGRADFLAHLPAGLANLEWAATLSGRRRLSELARTLRESPEPVTSRRR
ncbi:MAG: sugar phosphate nucleotidyltransferase [Opitutia bacterium]|jgi:aminoglycoside/choline kinase family phosphotransferase/choline kinase